MLSSVFLVTNQTFIKNDITELKLPIYHDQSCMSNTMLDQGAYDETIGLIFI